MSSNNKKRGNNKQRRKAKNNARRSMDGAPGGERSMMANFQRFALPRVHSFRRVYTEDITGSATGIVAYTPSVRLNQMPGFADFTGLFAEYRLNSIQLTIRADSNTLSVAEQYPTINMVFDPSSFSSLSGVTAATQYESWRQIVFSITKPQVMTMFKPNALASGAFVPSATTGSMVVSPTTFFPTTSPDVVMYGIKFITENLATTQALRLSYVCDWQFRIVN